MIVKQLKNCRYSRDEDLGVEAFEASELIRVSLERRRYTSCCIRLDTKKINNLPFSVWEDDISVHLQLSHQLRLENIDLGFSWIAWDVNNHAVWAIWGMQRRLCYLILELWAWHLNLILLNLDLDLYSGVWVLCCESLLFLQSQISKFRCGSQLAFGSTCKSCIMCRWLCICICICIWIWIWIWISNHLIQTVNLRLLHRHWKHVLVGSEFRFQIDHQV